METTKVQKGMCTFTCVGGRECVCVCAMCVCVSGEGELTQDWIYQCPLLLHG